MRAGSLPCPSAIAALLALNACAAAPRDQAPPASDGSAEVASDTPEPSYDAGDSLPPEDTLPLDTSDAESADDDASDPSDGSAEPDTTPADTTPQGPWFELGTGESGFEAISAGSPVSCNFGPQGSYHIWAAARLHDLPPAALQLQLRAELDGEAVGAGFAAPLDTEWTQHDDGTADLFGQFLYLDFGIDFPALSGQSLTIVGTLSGPRLANPLSSSATATFSCLQ